MGESSKLHAWSRRIFESLESPTTGNAFQGSAPSPQLHFVRRWGSRETCQPIKMNREPTCRLQVSIVNKLAAELVGGWCARREAPGYMWVCKRVPVHCPILSVKAAQGNSQCAASMRGVHVVASQFSHHVLRFLAYTPTNAVSTPFSTISPYLVAAPDLSPAGKPQKMLQLLAVH